MRRRRALHLLAAATLPLAGCPAAPDLQGATGSPEPTSNTTPPASTPTASTPPSTPTATATPAGPHAIGQAVTVEGYGEFAVEAVAVQRSVIHHHTWRTLYEPDDAQMLLVRVGGDAAPTRELPLAVRLDGVVHAPESPVTLSQDDGRYALPVPVRSADEAAVVLRFGEEPAWSLPADVRERLATAPEFHLHDATVRGADGRTVLDLVVENRGGRDGTFRGIVVSSEAADADAPVRFPVPAGETVTETVDDDVVDNWGPDGTFERDVTPDTRRFVVAA